MKKLFAGILALTMIFSCVIPAGAQAADEVQFDAAATGDEDEILMTKELDGEPEPPLFVYEKGDIDNSGKVDIEDAVMAVSSINGIKPLDEAQSKAADMNEDSEVDIEDVVIICNIVCGMPNIIVKPEPQPEPEPEPEPVDTRPRTSKGYVIEEIDGITYVDGILIANKSYSLPSTYAPGRLTAETQSAFDQMVSDAWNYYGISLWNCSGYRSYWYQNELYWGYVARDGQAAADTYSARPGHSEHQTGLALDVNYASSWFDTTKEAQWIADHCAEYGFILRYPKGKEDKTGYMYESWHIRYLGKDLARKVTDSGLTLEEYLGIDSYYH